MVRARMSLPALQQLMGHSQIHTTMLYVQLAPQDVWREYARRHPEVHPLGFGATLMNKSQLSLGKILKTHSKLSPFPCSPARSLTIDTSLAASSPISAPPSPSS